MKGEDKCSVAKCRRPSAISHAELGKNFCEDHWRDYCAGKKLQYTGGGNGDGEGA